MYITLDSVLPTPALFYVFIGKENVAYQISRILKKKTHRLAWLYVA